jgi:hypothetical protein
MPRPPRLPDPPDEPQPVPIDPFRVDGRLRRDLNPIAADPQLEQLLIEQTCRDLCRRLTDEAHFQRWIAKSASDLRIPKARLERHLRPYLPWEDPNPPAVPIPDAPPPSEVA